MLIMMTLMMMLIMMTLMMMNNHDDFDDDVYHDQRHDHRFTTGDHRCVTSGQQGLCCQKRVRQSKLLMIVSSS